MEGDDSHVEMKLSSDVDEEAGGNGVVEHLNRNQPPVAQKRSWQTTTLIVMAAVALFTLGEDAAPDGATSRPARPRQRDTFQNELSD